MIGTQDNKYLSSKSSKTKVVNIMKSIPYHPNAPITVGIHHAGLATIQAIGDMLTKALNTMIAAQERVAQARLMRYHLDIHAALAARDYRLADEFDAAKARSEYQGKA